MKNAIQEAADLVQAKKDRDELDQIWPKIKPKFDHLTLHLLEVLGYVSETDLPCPKQLQPKLWKLIIESLPLVLFEQASDLMLPLLEKQKLQEQVEALPQGDLIQEGCKLLAEDIVSHIPDWVDDKIIETFPEKLTAYCSDIQLTDKAQKFLIDTLNSIVKAEDPVYEPLWRWIESYLEGLFLKIAVKISRMGPRDLQRIQELAEKTRDNLLTLKEKEEIEEQESEDELNEKAQDVLFKFTDELFSLLGIQTNQDLFGVPQALQGPMLKMMKEKIAQGLLGIYSFRITKSAAMSLLLIL